MEGIKLEIVDNTVNVTRTSDDKTTRSYHGLMRTLVSNMVDGVSKGFEKKLEIVGIGYRSELHGNKLVFHLGYSHPIDFPLPAGISAEVEKQTLVTIKGIGDNIGFATSKPFVERRI